MQTLHPPASASSVDYGSVVVNVAGRRLQPSPVFDTYWRFTAARQRLFFSRLAGRADLAPDDEILRAHRFTNCYRASDRVSQFAIHDVAYEGSQDPVDVVFRVLLFKLFNKIATWQLLNAELGPIAWRGWNPRVARAILDAAWDSGRRLYSPAYVIPPPRLGGPRKHHDHLLLLETMMRDQLPQKVRKARSLAHVFHLLGEYSGIGDFLGFQFAIDLNYTSALDFDEDQFVVAGPGAKDGIRKCFGRAAAGVEAEVIAYMVDNQDEHFQRLGLEFDSLGGRPLHLIDCQNLFCEVDKYARVAHPEIAGISGRTRIKQSYRPAPDPLPAPWFPPKWGITAAVGRQLRHFALLTTTTSG
jgi:5-hmdU DNA kinase-like protein